MRCPECYEKTSLTGHKKANDPQSKRMCLNCGWEGKLWQTIKKQPCIICKSIEAIGPHFPNKTIQKQRQRYRTRGGHIDN